MTRPSIQEKIYTQKIK